MGAAPSRRTSCEQEPFLASKQDAELIKVGAPDEESSSSALILAADVEASECRADAEARLQISSDSITWEGASKPSSMLCWPSAGHFQTLGAPKFGSMLWHSTGSFKFLSKTLSGALLPPQPADLQGRLTVVLDLDETLIHSSFVPVWGADFIASVPVEGEPTDVWVYKRPHLDYFLKTVATHFEVVIFTASLATYADVVLDIVDQRSMASSGCRTGAGGVMNSHTCPDAQSPRHHPPRFVPNYPGFHQQNTAPLQATTMDPFARQTSCTPVGLSQYSMYDGSLSATLSTRCSATEHTLTTASPRNSEAIEGCSTSSSNVHFRLYRDSCVRVSGSYIKDLSRLGRPLARTVIVDNSPSSYMWNPDSAIPSVSYIDDRDDDGLLKILDVLMHLKESRDVRVDLPAARAKADYHVPVC